MTFRFSAVTTLSFTAIVLVACGGKTISIGNETAAQTVVPSAVTVATTECSQGFEHPNVCCTGGGNGSEPTCESYPNDPFHPCDSGWTTYPNAATCCSLDNPSDCTGSCGGDSIGNQGECQISGGQNPLAGIGGDAGATTETCETRCPPGYTGISPFDNNGCCQTDANGASSCFGEAVAMGSGSGTEDGSVSVTPSYGISACSFDCPDGWFVADAIEGLCCNNSSNGTEECFAAVFPDDNGGASSSPSAGVSGGSSTVTPTADAGVGQ